MRLRAETVRRTAVVGAAGNVLLSAVKVAVGVLGQSLALVADGVHSLSDWLSDLLVLLAGHHATLGPDEDHPYGLARYETVATLTLAFLLLAVALGIGWDAVYRLFRPEELPHPQPMTLVAALVSLGAKE